MHNTRASNVVSGNLDARNLTNIKVLCTLEARRLANKISDTVEARNLANPSSVWEHLVPSSSL